MTHNGNGLIALQSEAIHELQAENNQLWKLVVDLQQTVYELSNDTHHTNQHSERATHAASSVSVPYQAMFNHMAVPLVIFPSDEVRATINPNNQDLLHTHCNTLGDRFHPCNDSQAVQNGVLDCFRRALHGETVSMPPIARTPASAGRHGWSDDTACWNETTYFPIYDKDGVVRYVGKAKFDRTPHIPTERATQCHEEPYHALFLHMIHGFAYHSIVLDGANRPVDYTFLEVNDMFEQMTGLKRSAILNKRATQVVSGLCDDPFDWVSFYGEVALTGNAAVTEQYSTTLGQWLSVSAYSPQPGYFVTLLQDISERKQIEQENEQLTHERISLQDKVIAAQQHALAEMSTPLLPLADGVIAMPLVGTMNKGRASGVMETLLKGVAEHHARIVILDITGVRVVNTQVATALIKAAQAVKLLGVSVVLTGIQPRIAQILAGLGVDLSNIITRNTLQAGIVYALNRA